MAVGAGSAFATTPARADQLDNSGRRMSTPLMMSLGMGTGMGLGRSRA